jgi:hypothetical protein
MVSFRLNLALAPQDFSASNLFNGQSLVDATGAVDQQLVDIAQRKFGETASQIKTEITTALAPSTIAALTDECASEVSASLTGDGWRVLLPGRDILKAFCSDLSLGKQVVLQNSVIRALASGIGSITSELKDVMTAVSSDADLA